MAELVTVGDFQFLPEAEAARTELESEGITAFIADGQTVNASWFLGNAIGYIKLQVPEPQVDAARSALQRMRERQKRHEADERAGTEASTCLACGAEFPVDQTACPACGWSYAGSTSEDISEEPAPPDHSEPDAAEAASPMEKMRAMKRPVFLLFLSPFFIAAGVLVVLLLAWVVISFLKAMGMW